MYQAKKLAEIDSKIKNITKNIPKAYRSIGSKDPKDVWKRYWENNDPEKEVRKIENHLMDWRQVYLKYLKKNYKIIDAGCGLGKWVVYLNSEGYDIIGVEREKGAVKLMLQFYPSVHGIVCDVEALSFPDNFFDVYISGGVIEHFANGPQKALLEAKRVLRPDGLLLLSVPIRTPIAFLYFAKLPVKNFVKSLLKKYRSQKVEFSQYDFNKRELLEILKVVGFEILSVVAADSRRYAFRRFLPFLTAKSDTMKLNLAGRTLARVLESINPWLCTSHFLCVSKNRKVCLKDGQE